MSHELRTPLTASPGLAELLQMPSYGPLNDKQTACAQTIYQSSQHLLDLITPMCLLEVVSLDAGRLQLTLGPVEADELCQSSMRQILAAADRKQLPRRSQRSPA